MTESLHPLVASLNLSPKPGAVESNLRLARKALEEAARRHPRMRWTVLPELFTSGYSGLSSVHRFAEDAEDGPSVQHFTGLAKDLGPYIAYGFPEKRDGVIHNAANLVGPEGLLLTYRKRKLIRQSPEPEAFAAGDEAAVAYAGGVRIALAICST